MIPYPDLFKGWPQEVPSEFKVFAHQMAKDARRAGEPPSVTIATEEDAMRQRRRSEMPSEDEILVNQLFAAAHGLKLHPGLFNIDCGGREFVIERIEDNTAEMHPSVTIHIREVKSERDGEGRNTDESAAEQAGRSDDSTSETVAEEHS